MLRPPRVLRSPRGLRRRARGAGRPRSRAWRSGGSCRRSRGGSAARGGPVAPRDGGGGRAEEGDPRAPAILLEDLVGDAGEGPVERRVVENLGLLSEARYGGNHLLSLRASRGPLKGKARTTTVTLHAGVRRCQPPRPTRGGDRAQGTRGHPASGARRRRT